MLKNPLANADTGSVLDWEDVLEKEMVTHYTVLACEIPWTEDLVGYSPWAAKE